MNQVKSKEPFFFRFHLGLLIMVVLGFGANILLRSEVVMSPSTAIFSHGISMLLWYVLITVQSSLIGRGNYKLHMKLGQISIGLALFMLISGILITVISYQQSQDIGVVAVNLFIVIDFSILYYLGLSKRQDKLTHKRFMTFASISMLMPALGRVVFALGVNPFVSLLLLLVIVAIPIIYDRRQFKKVNGATKIGAVVVLGGTIMSLVLISLPQFVSLVDKLLL